MTKILLHIITSLAIAASASAATFTFRDVDPIVGSPADGTQGLGGGYLLSAGTGHSSYSGVFNFLQAGDSDSNTFTANGFSPAVPNGTIYDSVFGFDLADTATIGSIAFFFQDQGNPNNPEGGLVEVSSPLTPLNPTITSFVNRFVFSTGLAGTLFGEINSFGQLSYTITATTGEFTVFAGVAEITGEARNVPEGGTTLALLGGSLLGMAGLRKRFRRR